MGLRICRRRGGLGAPRFITDYESSDPVNISTQTETSIRESAATIAELAGYRGEVFWDTSHPDGQMVKIFYSTRLRSLGMCCSTPLADWTNCAPSPGSRPIAAGPRCGYECLRTGRNGIRRIGVRPRRPGNPATSRRRQVTAIGRDNYQKFRGQSCDLLINANGNSKKFLADDDPAAEFDASVASVLRNFVDFPAKRATFTLARSTFIHASTIPAATAKRRRSTRPGCRVTGCTSTWPSRSSASTPQAGSFAAWAGWSAPECGRTRSSTS